MKWEYKSLKLATKRFCGGVVDVNQLDSLMNQLGDEGWEIFSSYCTAQALGQTQDVVVIFKRQKA